MAQPVKGDVPGAERLFVVASPEELARAAAGRLWGIVRERATVLGRAGKAAHGIAVALSGGETPRPALHALSSPPYVDRFPWDSVHFFQVDERWVPPEDPASNLRMLRETLLSRAPVPPGHFHAVDTTLSDPAAGARRYEEELRAAFLALAGGDGPSSAGGGGGCPPAGGAFPRFDAILLGLGKDGHTASLFAGSPVLAESAAWAAASSGGDPRVPRVTLTLPVLNAAAHVIFLVSGKDKAAALRSVLSAAPPAPGSPKGEQTARAGAMPAALVAPGRGTVTFLADEAAAGGIPGGRR